MRPHKLENDVHFLTAPLRFVFSLVRAAIFLAVFPLVLFGLLAHALWIGGPIMDDDTWFLTKVLFCVLAPFAAALIAGVLSKRESRPCGRRSSSCWVRRSSSWLACFGARPLLSMTVIMPPPSG